MNSSFWTTARTTARTTAISLPGKYDGLVLRERILVALAVAAVLIMIWLTFIHDVLDASIAKERRAIQALANTIRTEAEVTKNLEANSAAERNQKLREEKNSLEAEFAQSSQALDQTIRNFVSPVEMTLLLKEILEQHAGLDLLRITNLDMAPLQIDTEGEASGVYRHGLRIEMRGGYFDAINFLESVEQSRWGMRWTLLNYSVESYPTARITLEVETLSSEQFVIGA